MPKYNATENQSFDIKAPADGFVVAIDKVPDPVFSQETLGPGIAIEPLGDTLCAPFDGKIIQCASTKHAVTIESLNGIELLVHMGIDTVSMKGEGLTLLVKEGDLVRAGTPLIRFDIDLLAQHATSLVSPLISIGKKRFSVIPLVTGRVSLGTSIARLIPIIESATDKTDANAKVITVKGKAIIALENGMHARPASKLRAITEKQRVKIILDHKERSAHAESITELLNLGLMEGDKVLITVVGTNAALALNEACKLLQTPEGIEKIQVGTKVKTKKNDIEKGIFYGAVASNGLSIAPLYPFTILLPSFPENNQDNNKEKELFFNAINTLKENLDKKIQGLAESLQADILAAHQDLLSDDELLVHTSALIETGKTAAFSWKTILDKHIASLEKSPNPLVRERSNDIIDLQIQLINIILKQPEKMYDINPKSAGKIIVAHDLTPSKAIALLALKPAGICLEAGGTLSHVAILCKAAEVPCIMGVGDILLSTVLSLAKTKKGEAILDAESGMLELFPSQSRIQIMQKTIIKREEEKKKEYIDAQELAISKDKRIVEVGANIGNALEAKMAFLSGSDGVGLFRSEFLFIDKNQAPTIEEQRSEYQKAVDALQGKPVVIRTIDIGADKQLSWLKINYCPNPALGVRGIRLLESNGNLIEDQLKALLQVKAPALKNGKSALKIMLPMVSDVTDIIAARKVIDRIAKGMKLGKNHLMPQLGAMIEVPSAALTVETIVKEVDFLSIGTNDLTQYTLAIDREETILSDRLDVLHPAILRLISFCIEAAKKNKCPVAVCGAAAGDPIAGIALAAIGVDELSMEPSNISHMKAKLRQADLKKIKAQIDKLMIAQDGAELRKSLITYLKDTADLN